MTSEKKTEANRRNALKSTGPRTPEGKAAVRLNALRHGLRSEEILLPGENEEALKELDEYLRAELRPVGELENLWSTGLLPPTGGFGAWGGWKPEYLPGNFTESWLNGLGRRLATTKNGSGPSDGEHGFTDRDTQPTETQGGPHRG